MIPLVDEFWFFSISRINISFDFRGCIAGGYFLGTTICNIIYVTDPLACSMVEAPFNGIAKFCETDMFEKWTKPKYCVDSCPNHNHLKLTYLTLQNNLMTLKINKLNTAIEELVLFTEMTNDKVKKAASTLHHIGIQSTLR